MFEHAPDLPVLAFVQHNLDPRIALTVPQDARVFHAQPFAVVQPNTFPQSIQQTFLHDRSNLNVVGLVQMRFRRRDSRGPLRIIGHQQQSLAGFVEPSHRSNPRQSGWQKGINSLASFFVGSRSNYAAGFIQHQIDLLGASP
jgi:hypothetical protein